MPKTGIIAITGGIGAGKSVVSTILRHAGYSVYDCDSRAKILMNDSPLIKEALIAQFGGADVYDDAGNLNRQCLAGIIFNDVHALQYVNSVVHPAVRSDIAHWCTLQPQRPVFIETAILKEGGLELMVDQVWNVTAPLEVRVGRVMKRNNVSREEVLSRISSQTADYFSDSLPIVEIMNDGINAVLPRVMNLLSDLKD